MGKRTKTCSGKGLNPLKGHGWFIAVAGRLGENSMNFGDREVMGIMEPSKDDKHIWCDIILYSYIYNRHVYMYVWCMIVCVNDVNISSNIYIYIVYIVYRYFNIDHIESESVQWWKDLCNFLHKVDHTGNSNGPRLSLWWGIFTSSILNWEICFHRRVQKVLSASGNKVAQTHMSNLNKNQNWLFRVRKGILLPSHMGIN